MAPTTTTAAAATTRTPTPPTQRRSPAQQQQQQQPPATGGRSRDDAFQRRRRRLPGNDGGGFGENGGSTAATTGSTISGSGSGAGGAGGGFAAALTQSIVGNFLSPRYRASSGSSSPPPPVPPMGRRPSSSDRQQRRNSGNGTGNFRSSSSLSSSPSYRYHYDADAAPVEDDGDPILSTTIATTSNIDEAMRSLYEMPDSCRGFSTTDGDDAADDGYDAGDVPTPSAAATASSSISLRTDDDCWFFDNRELLAQQQREAEESAVLLQRLRDSSNLDLLVQLIEAGRKCDDTDDDDEVEEEREDNVVDDFDAEDFEFGEFQSAQEPGEDVAGGQEQQCTIDGQDDARVDETNGDDKGGDGTRISEGQQLKIDGSIVPPPPDFSSSFSFDEDDEEKKQQEPSDVSQQKLEGADQGEERIILIEEEIVPIRDFDVSIDTSCSESIIRDAIANLSGVGVADESVDCEGDPDGAWNSIVDDAWNSFLEDDDGDHDNVNSGNNFSTSRKQAALHSEEDARADLLVAEATKTLNRLSLDVDSTKVSLVLPLDDLASPQARFARRLQVTYRNQHEFGGGNRDSTDQSVSPLQSKVARVADLDELDLPSYYFLRDFDDTARVLDALPWRCLPDYQPTASAASSHRHNEWDFWDENMVSRLCELDTALECVNVHLLSRIQPHRGRLEHANAIVHDCEQSLRLALMYWERLNDALTSASGSREDGSGLEGASVLLEYWNDREEYVELDGVLEELAVIFVKENDLFNRIDTFDTRESEALNEYFAVSRLSNELEAAVQHGRLSELHCLDDLRERLSTTGKRFWKRLLALSESVVVRSCRQNSFDWLEYERLVKAALDLRSDGFAEVNHIDVAADWCQSILVSLCHEADRALARSLLEPADAEPSEFEKELTQYEYEFNCGWGDEAKLKTLVHNLVIIRFCFETKISYFPRVFRKLMTTITDILHAHYLFTQWHTVPFSERARNYGALHEVRETECSSDDSQLTSILVRLVQSRTALWNHCEGVIVRLLSEYLDFAPRPKLFRKGSDVIDDSDWVEDLVGLQQVLRLSGQFYSLKGSFFNDPRFSCPLPSLKDGDEPSSLLYDKLGSVFRRHLRFVHIEAMESMGRALANENWILTSTWSGTDRKGSSDVESLLGDAFRAVSTMRQTGSGEIDICYSSENLFHLFPTDGNPFGSTSRMCAHTTAVDTEQVIKESPSQQFSDERREYINKVLSAPSAGRGDEPMRVIAPSCVSDVLIVWLSRLVEIIVRLPPIAEDVSAIFANICDLYFTTVFRICCGSSKNERILLGAEPPSPFVVLRSDTMTTPRESAKDARTPIFSSFRKSMETAKNRSSSRPPSVLPVAVEAEICAPLPKEAGNVSKLREFLLRAQNSLRDVVSLDMVNSWLTDPVHNSETQEEHACGVARVLEKRQGAIWSCFVVAALADVVLSETRNRMGGAYLGSSFVDDLDPLTYYVQMMQTITPDLAALACRFSCIRAISGFDTVKAILRVGGGWEECKLHEHANEYVDELVDRCSLIWGFLCVSAKLPFVVRKTVWEQLVSGAYLSLLEGFARVPFCSTEGRALMTLDLACFSTGIASASVTEKLEERALVASPPPLVEPERSDRYVDTYIKVFYYPPEDALAWIEENFSDYHLGHSVALVTATAGHSDRSLSEMVDRVMQLYGKVGEDAR